MKKSGEGTRALNFFIDTVIVFILAFAGFKTWNWYVVYWNKTPYNFGWFFFGVLFVYYTFFESVFARTPGKWFTYSKVVNKNGGRAAFWRILIRSLARITIIDLFFIPFLGKPLHDYISGTELVES